MIRQNSTASNSRLTSHELGPPSRRRPCPAHAPRRGDLDPIQPGHRPLGVALSGGGLRAALAGLGALRLLADVGRLGDIRHLTSVSGGSITAGLVAVRWDDLRASAFTRAALDEFVTIPILCTATRTSLQRDVCVRLWQALLPGRSRTDVLFRRLAATLLGPTRLKELPAGTWFEINEPPRDVPIDVKCGL